MRAAADWSQSSPLAAVAGVGSPMTPEGGDVAGEPGEVGGTKLRGEEGVGFAISGKVGDVVGGVGGGVYEFRRGGQKPCGFEFASVEAVSLFLRIEAFEGGSAGRAEDGEGAEAELGAEVAGHDVYEGGVAAVSVEEGEALEAGGVEAGTEVSDDGHKSGGGDREGAGEADVLV